MTDSFCITTERLTIRPMTLDDLDFVHGFAGRPDVAPKLGSVGLNWSREEAEAWVARAAYEGRPGFRAVIRHTEKPVGFIGIGKAPDDRYQTLGWAFAPEHWGKGYATEAARAFIGWCYDQWPDLGVLHADHFHDNPASGRVMQKLGFQRLGSSVAKSAAREAPETVIDYRLAPIHFKRAP